MFDIQGIRFALVVFLEGLGQILVGLDKLGIIIAAQKVDITTTFKLYLKVSHVPNGSEFASHLLTSQEANAYLCKGKYKINFIKDK